VASFIEKDEIKEIYTTSRQDAHTWREAYPAFERLMDNDLMEGLDPNLPEVNDGSLAAALFKLPKRIVSSDLSGTVKALNRDEAWMSVLANIVWTKEIIPYANTQAPFIRKWKDAVRKAAGYGSVPLITIFVETKGRRHADFIVAQPQDVTLEPGKVSDYDSDIKFWDVYYSKSQLRGMIEQAKIENKEAKESGKEGYNKWDIAALRAILKTGTTEERQSQDTPRQENNNSTKQSGFKFCIAVQEGVDAPFYMYHEQTDTTVREWSNPDPTGDGPIHFLYCYQDFVNPYGIGIVKLAGGTQNSLDYFRQADILATQLGLEPPIDIAGNTDQTDFDSIVFAQRAQWFTGDARVTPVQVNAATYQGLPERMSMYKQSLNQLIPTGDTSTSQGQGDPLGSKTPAGVKFAAASLSIDDEDFKDNLYITYAAVAKSMINTHFANMEGSDLLKLSDDEREQLIKAGLEFPEDENGDMSNQLEIIWDDVRANFEFEVDAEQTTATDDAQKLEGLMKVAELISNPATMQVLASGQPIMLGGKKLNTGELFGEIIGLTSDNDKILTDSTPEELAMQNGIDPATGMPIEQPIDLAMQAQEEMPAPEAPQELPPEILEQLAVEQAGVSEEAPEGELTEEQAQNIQAVMDEYGVDENTALAALAAEAQGFDLDEIAQVLQQYSEQEVPA